MSDSAAADKDLLSSTPKKYTMAALSDAQGTHGPLHASEQAQPTHDELVLAHGL